jgi:hypothetical protein
MNNGRDMPDGMFHYSSKIVYYMLFYAFFTTMLTSFPGT